MVAVGIDRAGLAGLVAAGSGVGVVAVDEQAAKNIELIAINRRAFNPIIAYLSDGVKDFWSRNMRTEKLGLYAMLLL